MELILEEGSERDFHHYLGRDMRLHGGDMVEDQGIRTATNGDEYREAESWRRGSL